MNKKTLFLAQSDTTVGFLSQDNKKIAKIKQRSLGKKFLVTIDSLKRLQKFARVPNKFKKKVRKESKSTFIYPNNCAIRVVKDEFHLRFLKKIGWSFSSSANLSSLNYDEKFAKKVCEIIVEDSRGLQEKGSSKLYKIGRKKIKRLR